MRQVIVAMCLAVTVLAAGSVAQASQLDITTLQGYGVATSAEFNFSSAGGWAGWSVPTGKVVLGAKIISDGDTFSDFAVFRPAGPGEVFSHYTYGTNEYGWVMQAKAGQANNGVKIEVYYADPLTGYTITKSPQSNYSDTGWGGWSAPSGNLVTGGGYQFDNSYSSAQTSEIGLESSVWPHYTFGSNEQGWVVQNGGVASSADLYVISAAAPAVPEPMSIILGAMGLSSIAGLKRLRRK